MDESSPSAEGLEVARVLCRRAAADLRVARKIAPDPEIDEEAIGFHAQQAVEKALKSALTLEGVDFPKTHDIDFLVKLAEECDTELSADIAGAGWLTPWGTDFRYDDEPLEALDKDRALKAAGEAVELCEKLLSKWEDPGTDSDRGEAGPDAPRS
jgi:HEPN domain-containing protein